MSAAFPVVIHHNPACGTSRAVLDHVRKAGHHPEVIEYLESGWTAPQLQGLFAAMGVSAREAMRENGSPAKELGLLEPSVSDETILAAMVAHPILVNRPIVATPKGVKLCRPSETVFDLLQGKPAG